MSSDSSWLPDWMPKNDGEFFDLLNRGWMFLLRLIGIPALIFGDIIVGGDMVYRSMDGATTAIPNLLLGFILGASLDVGIGVFGAGYLTRTAKKDRGAGWWSVLAFFFLLAVADAVVDSLGTYTGLWFALREVAVGNPNPNQILSTFPDIAKGLHLGLVFLTFVMSLLGNYTVSRLTSRKKASAPHPQPGAHAQPDGTPTAATPEATPAATPEAPPPPMTRLPGQPALRPPMPGGPHRPPMPQGDPRRNPPRR